MGKRLVENLEYILNCFLAIVYPKKDSCIICDEPQEETLLCNKCQKALVKVEEPIVEEYKGNKYIMHSCTHYTKELKKLIIAFKMHKDFSSGEILADMLTEGMAFWNIKGDIITYVPLSRRKERKRGFNQCYYLSKKISRVYNIPLETLLYKKENIKEQKKLSKIERKKNVEEAFNVINTSKIKDKTVILIDDVITTGATVLACANELKKFGAKEVNILTVGQSRI